MVAAGIAPEVLIQVAYAIGVAQPMSIYVNTFGKSKVNVSDAEIAEKIGELFDMRPKAIEERLKLRNPIYAETASYGHIAVNHAWCRRCSRRVTSHDRWCAMWSSSRGRSSITWMR